MKTIRKTEGQSLQKQRGKASQKLLQHQKVTSQEYFIDQKCIKVAVLESIIIDENFQVSKRNGDHLIFKYD